MAYRKRTERFNLNVIMIKLISGSYDMIYKVGIFFEPNSWTFNSVLVIANVTVAIQIFRNILDYSI